MTVMDRLDQLDEMALGPLNLIDQAEGLLKAVEQKDGSVRFAIVRMDRGGSHSLHDVARILERYGIPMFCHSHDAGNIYFRVQRRQAIWAEYLLLKEGIELAGKLIDPRNAQYAARRMEGWMQRPWAARGSAPARAAGAGPGRSDVERPDRQAGRGLNRSMNWAAGR